MSKGVDGLLDDYFRARWSSTNAPAAGTTCVATTGVVNLSSRSRNIIEMLGFSARNVTAAAVTMTLSVRSASIAGTVLASWDFILAANVGIQDCYSQLNINAPRGQDIVVEFGTPVASVTQKVSVSGWTEQTT
jgi:hypothetical protein